MVSNGFHARVLSDRRRFQCTIHEFCLKETVSTGSQGLLSFIAASSSCPVTFDGLKRIAEGKVGQVGSFQKQKEVAW